jgi:hypothetical protein
MMQERRYSRHHQKAHFCGLLTASADARESQSLQSFRAVFNENDVVTNSALPHFSHTTNTRRVADFLTIDNAPIPLAIIRA